MRSPLFALCLVVAASLPAAAEENRFNIHLETGALLTAYQPTVLISSDAFQIPGFHLRAAFEWALHERIGIEAAVGIDPLFAAVGSATTVALVPVVGARFRPWWNPSGGYLLPRPPPRQSKPLFVVDLLSDVWIDAHVGVAVLRGANFSYDVGVGTRIPVVAPLQLGLFARWQHIPFPNHYMQVMVGITASVGFKPIRSTDADGDGVDDQADRCPDTERGQRVNDRGCPYRESDTKAPKCSDTDLDGVCDGQDECPDTALGVQIDGKGCPIAKPESEESPPAE